MANYTSPKTWTTGDVLTAADMNTYVRDNVIFLANDRPKVRLYRSTDQSIPSANPQVVQFTSETFKNVASLHSNSTNNSRISVPSAYAGLWMFTAAVTFEANATGFRQIDILYNSSTVIARQLVGSAAGATPTNVTVTTVYQMTGNDWVEVQVNQNSGSSLYVKANTDFSPVFSGVWMMN